jgi:hypothetical protein
MNYLMLEANDELRALTRSTVQNCLNTLVSSYPRYLLFCSNYFHEIYYLCCLLAVDVLFMSRQHNSTLSEFFYSLRRKTSSRLRASLVIPLSILLQILTEYVESLHDDNVNVGSNNSRLGWWKRFVSRPVGTVNRIYRVMNALSITDYTSLTDHLLEVKVVPTATVRKNTFTLAVLVFSIKISQFYYARSKRKISVPPPSAASSTSGTDLKPRQLDLCYVCSNEIINPVATLDGFVRCFSCAKGVSGSSETLIKIMED